MKRDTDIDNVSTEGAIKPLTDKQYQSPANQNRDKAIIGYKSVGQQPTAEGAEEMVGERLRDMAMGILKARDAFVRDDFDEVWHSLYKIASPNFDKIEPWDELEKIAGYIKP